MKPEKNARRRNVFAGVLGFYLGLALLKFGNPVILNREVATPETFSQAWSDAWPPAWAIWGLLPLAAIGAWLVLTNKPRGMGSRWLWILPLVWLSWQFIAAARTEDGALTALTLPQLCGCVIGYFLGIYAVGSGPRLRWLLAGMLPLFVICLLMAYQQWMQFPQVRQSLLEGERTGWTNVTAEVMSEWRSARFVISTNGVEVANPVILDKLARRRVFGTQVYANALANALLLLLPCALVLAVQGTRRFRKPTRLAVIGLVLFLGLGGLFGTGSKSGWLVAMLLGGVWFVSLKFRPGMKTALICGLAVLSLVAFGLRFRNYFASGATSVGARFDYWRAALQNTGEHPLAGSGPGTFQRPYARIKKPESEMARLVHNDYLEQFSDSGIVGGISYLAWIGLLLATAGKRVWKLREPLQFGVFVGVLGWFVQGFTEFCLYIPALGWTAFVLAGCLIGQPANEFDKPDAGR